MTYADRQALSYSIACLRARHAWLVREWHMYGYSIADLGMRAEARAAASIEADAQAIRNMCNA